MEEQNQRHETLILKKQYNELLADKHRLEQEIERLKRFREEDRKEVNELQRQQQVKTIFFDSLMCFCLEIQKVIRT